MQKKLSLVIIICLLLITAYLPAQNTDAENSKSFILKGADERVKGNYTKAIEYYTKAELTADKKDHKSLFVIINNIGICYGYLSNYGEALSNYTRAMEIAKRHNMVDEQIYILCNIGILYSGEKNYNNAIAMFEEAYALAGNTGSDYSRVLIAINIADIYNKIKDYKRAQYHLKSVESLKKEKMFEQIYIINYAESLLIEGKITEAKKALEPLENITGKDLQCYVCLAELMTKIYNAEQKYDMAIAYANKGLNYATDYNDKVNLYSHLSGLYNKKRDYTTALQYKDSVITTKDSLTKSINRGLFESNKIKLKIQEYQNESLTYKEKQKTDRLLFILYVVISIIIFLFIYRIFKNRVIKQKQAKELAEKQQQIINLELEQRNNENAILEQQIKEKEISIQLENERLTNEIDKRNRQLSAKALNISSRNELIEDIIESFNQNQKLKKDAALVKHIRDLKKHLKTDEEWDHFISHFEEVNNNVLSRLQKTHPDLTPNDLRFIAYLYMNLSYKEISVILNITIDACAKRKERLFTKLNIPKKSSIFNYISNI